MSSDKSDKPAIDLQKITNSILDVVDQEREKEIISRRFGLSDRKETLEQIGNFLGITRERVRQLEKAITIRLKISAEENKIKLLPAAEKAIIRKLTELGRIARTETLAQALLESDELKATDKSQIAFIAQISDRLTIIDENDNYFESIGIAEYGDKKEIRQKVDNITKTIKANKQPITINELDKKLDYEHPDHIAALATVSKKLATLNGLWGLTKWPEVNPKNIKDKIYVILKQKTKPMHFSEISKEIKHSNFKRKDVTKQAIHNELIKDKRFVLIGRGIYALGEWGYKKGTVSDIIKDVLIKNKEPMYRDDIVKQVLKRRKVKETTVLLNLQSHKEFKRVAKATYTYQEPESK